MQSTSLSIKIFLILTFFVEIILAIWEVSLNRRMKKLKIQGFEKISEDEKRRRYSRKLGLLGLFTALLWLLLLIIILIIAPGRECGLQHAMETGVCVPCIDPNCMDCLKDSQVCNECPDNLDGEAFFLSKQGLCKNCDYGCDKCQDDGDGAAKCTECAKGYYQSQGKYCFPCTQSGCL